MYGESVGSPTSHVRPFSSHSWISLGHEGAHFLLDVEDSIVTHPSRHFVRLIKYKLGIFRQNVTGDVLLEATLSLRRLDVNVKKLSIEKNAGLRLRVDIVVRNAILLL